MGTHRLFGAVGACFVISVTHENLIHCVWIAIALKTEDHEYEIQVCMADRI